MVSRSFSFRALLSSRGAKLALLVQACILIYILTRHSTTPPRTTHTTLASHHKDEETLRPWERPLYFILIGIQSDTVSQDKRASVRSTWLSSQGGSLFGHRNLHRFFIPSPHCVTAGEQCDDETRRAEQRIKEEGDKHGDIERVSVLEEQSSSCTLLGALLEWAAEYNFEYLLRTDHDAYLVLPKIIQELNARPQPSSNYWAGFVWRDMPLQRSATWEDIPLATLPSSHHHHHHAMSFLGVHPPYTSGPLHVLSSDIVYALTSSLQRRHERNADQAMGLWLIPFNVTPHHVTRYHPWDTCHPDMEALRARSPAIMKKLHQNLAEGNLCAKMDTSRCPLCMSPCGKQQAHWVTSDMRCDETGASPVRTPEPDPEFDSEEAKADLVWGREIDSHMADAISLHLNDRAAMRGDPVSQHGEPAGRAHDEARYLSSVAKSVASFLPLASCERRPIQDGPVSDTSLLKNTELDSPLDPWVVEGSASVTSDGCMRDHYYPAQDEPRCVVMKADKKASLWQRVVMNQKEPATLVLSGWSKAVSVDHVAPNSPDYALLMYVTYVPSGGGAMAASSSSSRVDPDGKRYDSVFKVPFSGGTHDWQLAVGTFQPERPIQSVVVSCSFARPQGTVLFSRIVLSPLSSHICELHHQAKFLHSSAPSSLRDVGEGEGGSHDDGTVDSEMDAQADVAGHHHALNFMKEEHANTGEYNAAREANPPPPNFLSVWNRPQKDFRLRHRRAVESILHHHPQSTVQIYSNTLSKSFFVNFNEAGYDVQVLSYNMSHIGVGMPGHVWARGHSASGIQEQDYLKLLLLYKNGGVYVNLENVLMKPFKEPRAVIGAIPCYDSSLPPGECLSLPSYMVTTPSTGQPDDTKHALHTSLMAFPSGHMLLHDSLASFDLDSNRDVKDPADTYMTRAYNKLVQGSTVQMQGSSLSVTILPPSEFTPISKSGMLSYFVGSDDAAWQDARSVCLWENYNLNLKLTQPLIAILNRFTISKEITQAPEKF
eukprot:TRINITY_DN14173_c0_g1_i2.p1 TRINITY_DN14173_c0_g1~~TRINITY_DN14173_c0_g1_i2.p1  ORF type:complete len:997 (-),score=178.73 TRINITY_DN14173_c0_g1_i2:166-3156(-)